MTTVQHPNGHRMEGIWTLVALQRRDLEQPTEMRADLQLDHLMEYDSRNGRRADIPVALLLSMELQASDPLEALKQAIGAWCGTVLRAWDLGLPFDRLRPANAWWLI